MNACKKNRKLITWLVLEALDARSEEKLRVHLQGCEGCQVYFEEVSALTQQLAKKEARTNVKASEPFHQAVLSSLRAQKAEASPVRFAAQFRWSLLNWRVALPMLGAAVVTVFVLFTSLRPTNPPALTSARRLAPQPEPGTDLVPTISNYQMVAKRSFDKLDELLTEQGGKSLPQTPLYRASTLPLPTSAD